MRGRAEFREFRLPGESRYDLFIDDRPVVYDLRKEERSSALRQYRVRHDIEVVVVSPEGIVTPFVR